jgi:hypothetical protein
MCELSKQNDMCWKGSRRNLVISTYINSNIKHKIFLSFRYDVVSALEEFQNNDLKIAFNDALNIIEF